jgi:hypothetical protein
VRRHERTLSVPDITGDSQFESRYQADFLLASDSGLLNFLQTRDELLSEVLIGF